MPSRAARPTAEAVEKRLLGARKIRQLNADVRTLAKANLPLAATEQAELHPGWNGGVAGTTQMNWLGALVACEDRQEVFARCRALAGKNDFIRLVVFLKKLVLMHGLDFPRAKPPQARLLRRLLADMATEWFICENVVAAWVQPAAGQLPFVSIPDCEATKYSDAFGAESLQVLPPKEAGLDEAQREKLGPRYARAILAGEWLKWGAQPEELFHVLTSGAVHPSGKAGTGLGMPSMWSAFETAATYALLSTGDWNASTFAKDVIRAIRKGHKIDSGNLAGMPLHFLKAAERDIINAAMKGKQGAFDVVVNWDVLFEYVQFDMKYFGEEKWDGVRSRLNQWAGPLGQIAMGAGREERPGLLKLAQIEMQEHRRALSGFLIETAEMFGLRNLAVEFSPSTLLTQADLLALVNSATSSGLMSYQTGRRHLGLDDREEGDLLEASHKKPARYTPPFERNQGIVGDPPPVPNHNPQPATGGRPPG